MTENPDTYFITDDDSIVCKLCKRESFHPADVTMKYCDNCKCMHETGLPRTEEDVAHYYNSYIKKEKS